jgi:hypothetical protein
MQRGFNTYVCHREGLIHIIESGGLIKSVCVCVCVCVCMCVYVCVVCIRDKSIERQ